MHDTGLVPAVAQLEGVAQFMDRLLEDPFMQRRFSACKRCGFVQTVGGDDTGLSAQLGFAVYMGQYGNKKVHPCDGQYLDGMWRGRIR